MTDNHAFSHLLTFALLGGLLFGMARLLASGGGLYA